MLKQIEGSRAVAEAVAMCRPQVICAYPITPQTHIVEALSAMVQKDELTAEFLNVESEFAAMSVAIGASATGARAYTATASQGLLYMSAMVGPEAFTEVRYLAHERMQQALGVIQATAADFATGFGRDSGGLVRPYRTDDAEIVVVALGSVLGTLKDAVDELRADGLRIGVLGITSFRPFPADAIRLALGTRTRHVVVLERALAPGSGGIVTADIHAALAAWDLRISTVVAGLGGRAVTRKSLCALLTQAGDLPPLSFVDLNTGLVEAEVARMSAARRSGPSAENILRDLGVTASRIG